MSPRQHLKQSARPALAFKRGKTMKAAMRVKKEQTEAKPVGGLTWQKCRAITRAVASMPTLSGDIQQRITELNQSLQGSVKPSSDALIPQLGDILRQVNDALVAQTKAAQAKADNEDAELASRVDVQSAAQQRILDVRREIAEKKVSIKEAEKEISSQKVEVDNAKAQQRLAESEIKRVEGKRKHLEDAETEAFLHLKEEAAVGPEGQKRLKMLKQIGQTYKFHPELMQVSAAVFKKDLAKRRTFDNVILQHFEVEMAKQSSELQHSLMAGAEKVGEHATCVKDAQQQVLRAKEEHKQRGRELKHLETTLQESKDAQFAARRSVRKLPTDMKMAKQEFARSQARLTQFRKGPLAAFSQSLPRPAKDEPEEEGLDC